MPRTTIDIFDHASDLEHLDVIHEESSPVVIDRLADAAQTVQSVGQAVLLWYDSENKVLRVKSVPLTLEEG